MKKTQPKSPNEADKYVGSKLRAIRLEQKLSQRQLAEKVKVTFQQIQKYEKGINRISIGTLFDICTVLNTSPSDFLKDFGHQHKVAESNISLLVKEIVEVVTQLPISSRKKILLFAQKLVKNKGKNSGE